MGKSKSATIKSKKLRTRTRKTRHNRSEKNTKNESKSHVVKIFFEMLTTVKLYHWKTKSYAQHKATDELYQHLNENIDKFVEVWLGKDESRIKMIEKKLNLLEYTNTTDFKEKMYKYRDFLTDMNKHFNEKKDSDLLSIRDDILVDVNQFLYLMTFH
jgi:DNA-binding ferritin-like protein